MDLHCEEDLSLLLVVPSAECNMLDSPEELLYRDDADSKVQLDRLPLRCDEVATASRLGVLLSLEAGQLTTNYMERQPFLDSTHRFAIVQWLHVVRS